MFTSKLTAKYQATIPKEIRKILHLEKADRIIYRILKDNTVVLSRATPLDLDYLRSISKTLNEWDSEEDDEAFRNL